jgi:hypothetical protein
MGKRSNLKKTLGTLLLVHSEDFTVILENTRIVIHIYPLHENELAYESRKTVICCNLVRFLPRCFLTPPPPLFFLFAQF